MVENFKKILKSISETERKEERFLSHILIPLWVLTSYFLLSASFLPAGVNNALRTRGGKYSLLLVSALTIAFLAFVLFKKKRISFLSKSEENFSTNNIILLLLPLTRITQYILNNLSILSTLDVIYVFLAFTISIAFFVLFIPILLKKNCIKSSIDVFRVSF